MISQISEFFHFFFLARLKGLEPLTHSLEGCCSIHLSYRRIQVKWSGREDLNLRLSAPKADALPGCATPRIASQLLIPNS